MVCKVLFVDCPVLYRAALLVHIPCLESVRVCSQAYCDECKRKGEGEQTCKRVETKLSNQCMCGTIGQCSVS